MDRTADRIKTELPRSLLVSIQEEVYPIILKTAQVATRLDSRERRKSCLLEPSRFKKDRKTTEHLVVGVGKGHQKD